MRDPMRLQLLKQIGSADQVEELRNLRDQVHEQMEALLPTCPVEQFNEQLNEIHDAVIQRSISLAEAEMARAGKGSPPVPYAYLLFGSGGREEQTLSSDQDSGVVYEDPVSDSAEEVLQYFRELCQLIVLNLQAAGYPPCEGNVLSSNPEWCLSQSAWREKLEHWFMEPAWEAVRYLLIIADGRSVYGEERLLDALKDSFFTDMLNHPIILKRMLDNTVRHKVLLGIFGQLLKEQYGVDTGSLDIKYGAYIPMVNSIRLMAIQIGIRETSTLERIKLLVKAGKMSEPDAAVYEQAFRFILRLRLMSSKQDINGYYANNGKLSSRKLTKEMTDELKSSLRLGKKLQRAVFRQTMGRLT